MAWVSVPSGAQGTGSQTATPEMAQGEQLAISGASGHALVAADMVRPTSHCEVVGLYLPAGVASWGEAAAAVITF